MFRLEPPKGPKSRLAALYCLTERPARLLPLGARRLPCGKKTRPVEGGTPPSEAASAVVLVFSLLSQKPHGKVPIKTGKPKV